MMAEVLTEFPVSFEPISAPTAPPFFSNITGDPDYQNLAPDEQYKVRRGFYQKVLTRDPDYQKLSQDERQTVSKRVLFPEAKSQESITGQLKSGQAFSGAAGNITQAGLEALAAPAESAASAIGGGLYTAAKPIVAGVANLYGMARGKTAPEMRESERKALGALESVKPYIAYEPQTQLARTATEVAAAPFTVAQVGLEKFGVSPETAQSAIETAGLILPIAIPALKRMGGAAFERAFGRAPVSTAELASVSREPAFVQELTQAKDVNQLNPRQQAIADTFERGFAEKERAAAAEANIRQSPQGSALLARQLGEQETAGRTAQAQSIFNQQAADAFAPGSTIGEPARPEARPVPKVQATAEPLTPRGEIAVPERFTQTPESQARVQVDVPASPNGLPYESIATTPNGQRIATGLNPEHTAELQGLERTLRARGEDIGEIRRAAIKMIPESLQGIERGQAFDQAYLKGLRAIVGKDVSEAAPLKTRGEIATEKPMSPKGGPGITTETQAPKPEGGILLNDKGEALTVYHGGRGSDFTQFDLSKAKNRQHNIGGEKVSNESIWFVENRRVAERFANQARTPSGVLYPDAFVKEANLSLKNPLIVDMNDVPKPAQAKEWSVPALDTGKTIHEIGFVKEEILRKAKAAGHDGVIFKNGYDQDPRSGDIYAVFQPEQVKLKSPNPSSLPSVGGLGSISKPTFQQTEAGPQSVIPGAEGRTVPNTPLRPKRTQTEAPMDLEQPGIAAKEPGLFEKPTPTLESAIGTAEARQSAADTARAARLQSGRITLPEIKTVVNRDNSVRDLTKATIREQSGEMMRRRFQFEAAMRKESQRWESASIDDSLRFIDSIEKGGEQATTENQALARSLRVALDERRTAIQNLGTGKLENFVENYFPHVWSKPGEAARIFGSIMGKRPLQGPASFLKKRTIPTTADGIQAGLTPVTYNPVKLTMLKLAEMDRYIMAQNVKTTLEGEGLAKYVSVFEKPPEGWVKLNDRVFARYGKPTVTATSFESYDPMVRKGITDVLDTLKVDQSRPYRVPGHPSWLGAAGGTSKVITQFGSDIGVMEHELGHILDNKYGLWDYLTNIPGKDKPAVAARVQMRNELRALADMRYEGGEVGPSYKNYVRKKPEQMANAINALIYMPERMSEVAPTVKARLVDFVKSHDETRSLLDLQKSLVAKRDSLSREIPVGGLVIRGNYFAPPEAAKVLNNYLSPGLQGNPAYDAIRYSGNLLNQAQLGVSAFHLGFTSIDAITSDAALAIEQASRGNIGGASKSLLRAATLSSPIENAITGNRLLKEYLDPGSYSKLSREADALAKAGGRPYQDTFYKNQAIDSFWKSWKEGDWARVGLKTLPAALEYMSKPVMDYIVPRQKLGVFAKISTDILDRASSENWNEGQTRAAVQKAWDSVDSRMGQLVYDNLFWNKTVKDLGMASVRSLGWNLGTVREIGGGLKDVAAQGVKAVTGNTPEMTHRMAYVVALPIVVGYLGAIYNYLSTGEAPQDMKDYYFPRSGGIDTSGRPERLSLASYMKDVYAFAKHPLKTVSHKVHPLLSAVSEMLQNEDFYGTEIRHSGDPLLRQVEDVAKYVGNVFTPFSVRNAQQRAKAAGEDTIAGAFKPEELGKTAQSFVGITPAPASVNKTDAEELAQEFVSRRIPTGPRTHQEADQRDAARSLEQRFRVGKAAGPDLLSAIKAGTITERQAQNIYVNAKTAPLARSMKVLRLDEAVRVWDVADEKERRQIRPLVLAKIEGLANYPEDQRKELIKQVMSAPGLVRPMSGSTQQRQSAR